MNITDIFIRRPVLAVVLNVLPSAVLAGPVGQRVLLLLWLACVVIASRQR